MEHHIDEGCLNNKVAMFITYKSLIKKLCKQSTFLIIFIVEDIQNIELTSFAEELVEHMILTASRCNIKIDIHNNIHGTYIIRKSVQFNY